MGRVVKASLAFSAFDYLGFNLTKNDPAALRAYRVAQLAVQAGLTYDLWQKDGLASALSFETLWWTFNDDLLYYAISEFHDPGEGWASRGAFRREVLGDRVTWAHWTPEGLARGGKTGRPIPGRVLLIQAGVGVLVALLLPALF